MHHDFWHQKWQEPKQGFHENRANALLMAQFEKAAPSPGGRILVPLCGKSLDLVWLRQQGFSVIGVELVEKAVVEFFDELSEKPTIRQLDKMTSWSTAGIEIFVGDIFDLTPEIVGPIDLVYDRAALVALPEDMRREYSQHLHDLSGGASQLLVSFDYDQNAFAGPPFAINDAIRKACYGDYYAMHRLEISAVPEELSRGTMIREEIFHLTPKIAKRAEI